MLERLKNIEVIPWTVPIPVVEAAWTNFVGVFQDDPDFAAIMQDLCAERTSEDESEVNPYYYLYWTFD